MPNQSKVIAFDVDQASLISLPIERCERDVSHGGGLGLGFFIAKTLLERSGAKLSLINRAPPLHGAAVSSETRFSISGNSAYRCPGARPGLAAIRRYR